jgi:hypothetical protein
MEPHFRLPFLSWLPNKLGDTYVRMARKGTHYDCNLPTRKKVTDLFAEAGFASEDVTVPAMRLYAALEELGPFARTMCAAPTPVLRLLLPLNPTMIFLLRPANSS